MLPPVITAKPWLIVISCVIAYLLGSISSGLMIAKASNGPDLRKVGSGNTGASNVQRTMGWKAGILTFVGDSLKAVIACLIAELITGDHMAALPAGLFAVLGHNWPVYYHFKGGKGVAASCGVLAYCFWLPAVICFALTIILIVLTRYISLGSMFLLISYAILVSVWGWGYQVNDRLFVILWAVILALICIGRHHANIVRLIKGTENKLGNKVKA